MKIENFQNIIKDTFDVLFEQCEPNSEVVIYHNQSLNFRGDNKLTIVELVNNLHHYIIEYNQFPISIKIEIDETDYDFTQIKILVVTTEILGEDVVTFKLEF